MNDLVVRLLAYVFSQYTADFLRCVELSCLNHLQVLGRHLQTLGVKSRGWDRWKPLDPSSETVAFDQLHWERLLLKNEGWGASPPGSS